MVENDQIKINEPMNEKLKAIKAASDHLPSIKHLYPYKYTQVISHIAQRHQQILSLPGKRQPKQRKGTQQIHQQRNQ
jgi:hypothetical protein